jgi:hypothetical protein
MYRRTLRHKPSIPPTCSIHLCGSLQGGLLHRMDITKLYVQGSVHHEYMSITVQQDATIYSLFISVNRSTCFGWYFHPSSGAHITVSTASGISYCNLSLTWLVPSQTTNLEECWPCPVKYEGKCRIC